MAKNNEYYYKYSVFLSNKIQYSIIIYSDINNKQ